MSLSLYDSQIGGKWRAERTDWTKFLIGVAYLYSYSSFLPWLKHQTMIGRRQLLAMKQSQ